MDDDNLPTVYYIDTRNAREHRPGGASGTFRPHGIPHGAVPVHSTSIRRSPAVIVQQPTLASQRAAALGNLSTGDLIDAALQALVALTPLPAAPVASGTAATDVENLVIYQGALALHAKRDEQLRTLGHILQRVIG